MSEQAKALTILLPLDLAAVGEVKIQVAEEYARALSADVLLLHVLRPGLVDPANILPSEAIARTYLDTVEARLRGCGIHAQSVLRTGATASTIVHEALIHEAYLIILGTNVRPLLSSAVLGSVADQVARTAPCPVLLVHPQGFGKPVAYRQLRCFVEDAERAGSLTQRNLGMRTIQLARIVGSVDRCNELGLDFRPPERRRRKHDEDRLNQIRRALARNAALPAIDVYKLGFGYYVLDGHHRVAAAMENGQVEIDANVVEYVPVTDAQAPERFAARRAFERATGLSEVGAAQPASYRILLDAIEHYRVEQGLAELPIAAQRWFAEVFRPLWQTIRARELTALFPGERAADLIARLAVWCSVHAPDVVWTQGLEQFLEAQAVNGTGTGTVNVTSRNG